MKQKKPKNHVPKDLELYLRVLCYKTEEGIWAAHCLETDLVGYGHTFRIALKKLEEITKMQISFAFYKKQPALLDRPAPPDIIEIYNTMVRSNLQNFPARPNKVDPKRRVTSILLPHKSLNSDFAIASV